MQSTWETRDLPVLEAIVLLSDERVGPFGVESVVPTAPLSEPEVQATLRALSGEHPPLLENCTTMAGGSIRLVGSATGEARRRVGAWPTPENLATRMLAALEEAAQSAPTAEERTRLQRVLEAVRDVGTQTVAAILAGVVTGVM